MSLARLERALEIVERWRADPGREDRAALLARHADLRDLIEPLLDESEEAVAATIAASAPSLDANGALAEGAVLGDFRILRELGRGGMGVVYEAQQISLERRVALKVLPATTDPTAIARFKREATTAGKLAHPGIVKVLAVGSAGGLHYFAMELVAGRPLTGAHGLGTARAVTIVAEVAEALDHAHANGVLHRDVKPGNILLCADGRAVLTDFGLARDEDLPGLSHSGTFAGTPYYMAPEQCQRRAGVALSARSDVFSLGVTLYELLTGVRPFRGEGTFEVMDAILRDEPDPPTKHAPDLAPDLVAIVAKAIEKDPADRYASAAAFAADLRAFLDYRPVSAVRPTGFARLRRYARREPAKVGLLASGALVLGLIGYVAATSSTRAAGAARQREEEVERLLSEGYSELQRASGAAAAETVFARARELAPDSVEALAGLALARVERGQVAEAIAELDEAPATPALEVVRAAAMRKRGDVAAAEPLERALSTSSDTLAKFVLGSTTLTRAKANADKALAREALALLGSAVLGSRRSRMSFHFLRGLAATEAGDVAAATEAAAILAEQWPDAGDTGFFVGTILAPFDRGRATVALEGFVKAHPDAYRALTNLANCYFEAGRKEEAFATIDRAIALAPDDGIVLLRRAWFRYSTDDLEGAAKDATDGIANAATHGQGWLLVAMIRSEQGDSRGAIQAARRAVECLPAHARGRYLLGQLLLKELRFEPALAEFAKVSELDPKWVEPHLDTARIHAAQGRPRQALAAAATALACAPGDRERILAELRASSSTASLSDPEFRRFLAQGAASRPASTTTR